MVNCLPGQQADGSPRSSLLPLLAPAKSQPFEQEETEGTEIKNESEVLTVSVYLFNKRVVEEQGLCFLL